MAPGAFFLSQATTPPVSSAPAASKGLPVVVWLGFAISAAFLVYFFRGVSWSDLAQVFRTADLAWVAPAVALNLATYPIRAYRWGFLLPRTPEGTFRNRLTSTAIGFMASSIFPARAGELVRAVLHAGQARLPVGTTLASLILERLFDLVVVLGALVVVLVALPTSGSGAAAGSSLQMAKNVGAVFGVAVVGLVGFLVALRLWTTPLLALVDRLLGVFPEGLRLKIAGLVRSIVDGLMVLSSFGQVVLVMGLSLVHWGVAIFSAWVASQALHLNMNWLGALLLFVFTSLSVALPQAPGFIGVYQVAAATSLTLMGAPDGPAKGFALLIWAVSIVPITLMGFLCLSLEGLTLAQIRAPAPAGTDAS